MMRHQLRRVAAFAEGPLEGNPAGVVVLPGSEPWPEDRVLQQFAAEVGFSETAYVRRETEAGSDNGRFLLRWFTPKLEVALCGHATLAAAFCLWETKVTTAAALTFITLSGELHAGRDPGNDRIQLDFPADPPADEPLSPVLHAPLAAALGIDFKRIAAIIRGRFDVAAVVDDEVTVFHCQPDCGALAQIDARGIILTAPSAPASAADFTSRFFAPRCGIAEDPVTGSAHCLLGPYWAQRLGRQMLAGYQASHRGGIVHVSASPGATRVSLAGCARFMR